MQLLILALALGAESPAPQINPFPREVLRESLVEWNFDRAQTEGWTAEHNCTLTAEDGLLKVQTTGTDPYMHLRVDHPGGEMLLEIKARSTNDGPGQVYWITLESPRRGDDKVQSFALEHDGQWHEYSVPFVVRGQLSDVRIDPGFTAGQFDIDWIRLVRQRRHPLAIEAVEVEPDRVRFVVRNHGSTDQEFSALGEKRSLAADATLFVDNPVRRDKPLERISVELQAADLPSVARTVFLFHPEVEGNWITRPLGDFSLDVAGDGSSGRIRRGDRLVAVIAPLVHDRGVVPALSPVEGSGPLRFEGQGISLSIGTSENEFTVAISSDRPLEGPVVRVLGGLEQGLLAGLEYLGKGERSSTKLDMETEDYLRCAPDPVKVTMPLMSFATDLASVSMTWSDMTLEPKFATPNFFDATGDHRMALAGRNVEASIRVDQQPLEEAILWAVKKRGFPPVPDPPRSRQEQWELCMTALNGPLKTKQGWGHCVESRWQRQPYADMASTIWRITGQLPNLPQIVPGGSHVRNDAVYFLTDRAFEWQDQRWKLVKQLLEEQREDGSFRYSGKYARGHFEDTASGVCGRPAATLLEHARVTGDQDVLAAALKTLEYTKRFRTPRGAQVWEIPLHTPDLLASAYLVWAYARGYELTGNEEYLREARKWALSGVPFVYLWSRYPVMLYATPPVYGATNWQAPVWIGLPVQWVGIVYAYSLTMLAPHDDSLDWNQLARGILVAGEQMQFPADSGEYAGLLPDAFALANQERRPWRINPCALVSLRMVLDGELDFLCVVSDGKHRVASPFPVKLEGNEARIKAVRGATYQIVVDGQQILDIKSQGDDVVSLK
jgi:hypothetical protein